MRAAPVAALLVRIRALSLSKCEIAHERRAEPVEARHAHKRALSLSKRDTPTNGR
jgi:hypothetical protein